VKYLPNVIFDYIHVEGEQAERALRFLEASSRMSWLLHKPHLFVKW
jgi:hypothetical protein